MVLNSSQYKLRLSLSHCYVIEIELSFLSKKETRALISGIKKFGDIENRIGEVAPQIGLESKDPKVVTTNCVYLTSRTNDCLLFF